MRIAGAPSASPFRVGYQLATRAGMTPLFFDQMAPALWDAALVYGVDPVVMIAQSGHETGWGKFGGNVRATFCNPAGIKIARPDDFPGCSDGDRPLAHAQFACLPGGALVFTAGGPLPIERVRVGDMVWSLDGSTKTFRLARVWQSQSTGIDEVLHVHTMGRVLRCTAQHRVLVRRKRDGWRTEWTEASTLGEGDHLVGVHGLPDQVGVEAPSGRVLTEGFMAFAGLLIGDGSIYSNRGGSKVQVARHPDAPYAPAYMRFAEQEFQTSKGPRLGIPKGAECLPDSPIRWIEQGPRGMQFTSASAVRELRELGFAGTAMTKRVPEWVYGLRPDLVLALLRGYLDSDGAVKENGQITFSSVNRNLLEDVRHLCMLVGVPITQVCRLQTAGAGIAFGRPIQRRDMYQLMATDPRANLRIGSHHPVKQRRLEEAAAAPRYRISRWDAGYKGRGRGANRPGEGFELDGAVLLRVQNVVRAPAQPVYDLGVEGTHSYIADGIVVHNSWAAGAHAHAQHLMAYCQMPLPKGAVLLDPRWQWVYGRKAAITDVEQLSGSWAPSATYGQSVATIAQALAQ